MSKYFIHTGSYGYKYLTGTKWITSPENHWLDYDVWKSKELYVYETNHIDSFQSIQLKQNTKLLKII